MSEVIHFLLSKVKYTQTLSSKENMVQCKILIQLFPSWKQGSPHPCYIWLVKLIQVGSHPLYRNVFNVCTKKKELPEPISGRFSLSMLLYSRIKREHWHEMKY